MNRSSNSKSSLFLMEMMIAILFFSLASAVCLRMFTRSSQMSKDTTNLNMAVNQAGNAAELLKAAGQASGENRDKNAGDDLPGSALLLSEYPDAVRNASSLQVFYDEEWTPCDKEKGAYFMEITCSKDALLLYHIHVAKVDDRVDIYSIDLKLHCPVMPSQTEGQADKEAGL